MMIAGRQRIQGPKESIFQLNRRKIDSLSCAFSEANLGIMAGVNLVDLLDILFYFP